MEQFCHKLPKVELHAHLNTSYSLATLRELIVLSGNTWEHVDEEWYLSSKTELDEHFRIFSRIQKLVKTEEAIYLLTCRVIEEFAEDNVKYLELRSTPKCIPETGMTYELYIRTMIRAVKDCEKKGLNITVRLLPSIDRRLGVDVAQKTVDVADILKHESSGIVVGIDFSGDPTVGNAEEYIPIFLDASRRGLKLALHLAEIPLFEETKKVLMECVPHSTIRIGHGTYIHRFGQGPEHSDLENFIKEKKIPIETCMTSNLLGKTVGSLDQHHFKYWWDRKHPVIICTDGKGTYNSTLTQEYVKAATTFGLTKHDLHEYVLSTVESIFETQSFKQSLKEKFKQILIELKN